MMRWNAISLLILGLFNASAPAQPPAFQWKSGQVLTYRVAQTNTAVESLKDADAMTTVTQMDLVKKWQVVDVAANGTATLQMTLSSLRMETRPPKGETLLFDSAKPDAGTPGLREELAKYMGPVLTTVQIDARGQLVAVQESKFGPASRLQCDLPFKLVLPGGAVAAGQSWERTYAIKLDPPQGAGESYDAIQKYACKSINGGVALIGVTTEVKGLPESSSDRVPLLPLMPSGEIAFDVTNGRLKGAQYVFQHDLTNHRGDGSKYTLKTAYTENLIDSK